MKKVKIKKEKIKPAADKPNKLKEHNVLPLSYEKKCEYIKRVDELKKWGDEIKLYPIGFAYAEKELKLSSQVSSAPEVTFIGNYKEDYFILDHKNGENFVLKNNHNPEIIDNHYEKNLEIKGLPEGGKREVWNFLRIQDRSPSSEEMNILSQGNDKYILEDYDNDCNESENFRTVINIPKKDINIHPSDKADKRENYITSPYIINLKEKMISNLVCPTNPVSEPGEPVSESVEPVLDGQGEPILPEEANRGKKFRIKIFSPAILNFVFLAIVIVLPIYILRYYVQAKNVKGRVLGASASALENLKVGRNLLKDNSLFEAKKKFLEAEINFKTAGNILDEVNNVSYNLAFKIFNKDEELESARALLKAGEKASEISRIILNNFESFDLKGDKIEIERIDLVGLLEDFHNNLTLILPKIYDLKTNLDKVNESKIPDDYKSQIKDVKEVVDFISRKVENYEKIVELMSDFVGKDREKRYLLIFQNDNELRPTGGFIGSYALLDILKGKIVNMEMSEEGSYALQGSLLENINPPYPLRLVNSRWEFQDANWWPDFPQSAKNLMYMYEKSGGPSVDGVIAINASLVKKLFAVTGAIEMDEYGKIINSDNFILETQKAVELEYNQKDNKPKKFVADLMSKFLKRLFDLHRSELLESLVILSNGLRERDLQLYFSNTETEEKTLELGWAGDMKDIRDRDYLEIVSANIGGRKTDEVIESDVRHKTEILEDGSIIDEVQIIRKNNGVKGDYFTGVNNVNYLRLYVPEGSILLSAEGFNPPPKEIFKELKENIKEDDFLKAVNSQEKVDIISGTVIGNVFKKTYFANWTQVKPGAESTVRFKYKLPFKAINNDDEAIKYSLYIQKQSGIKNAEIIKDLKCPDDFETVWTYPGEVNCSNGEWIKLDNFKEDKFYGVIFVKKRI